MDTINGPSKTECIRNRVFTQEMQESVADMQITASSWEDLYKIDRLPSTLEMAPVTEFEDDFWVKHPMLNTVIEKATQLL